MEDDRFFPIDHLEAGMPLTKAAADPTTLTFEATVESGGREVVLSESYFYPESGGQPADRGILGGCRVLDVQYREDEIVHVLDGELSAGEAVTGSIDPSFRRYCMRAHTASHALYGAGRRLFEDLGYGGFGITDEKIRVDLATSSTVDDATLVELERLVNRCVWDSRPVTWQELPREVALEREDVAFNAKTEEGLAGETVRVVEIDGWDAAACGGTHVANTREIGPVTVLDRSNPGEGLTRVEFAVGPTAIVRRTAEKRAVLGAARTLETNVDGLVDAVDRLRTERADLADERDALRDRLLDRQLAALREDAFERAGTTWLAGVVDADGDTLADRVREQPADVGVLVLATPDGRLAVGTDGSVDADGIIEEVTAEFGGGGGGSQTAAQAGGLDADGEAIVAFLRPD